MTALQLPFHCTLARCANILGRVFTAPLPNIAKTRLPAMNSWKKQCLTDSSQPGLRPVAMPRPVLKTTARCKARSSDFNPAILQQIITVIGLVNQVGEKVGWISSTSNVERRSTGSRAQQVVFDAMRHDHAFCERCLPTATNISNRSYVGAAKLTVEFEIQVCLLFDASDSVGFNGSRYVRRKQR